METNDCKSHTHIVYDSMNSNFDESFCSFDLQYLVNSHANFRLSTLILVCPGLYLS